MCIMEQMDIDNYAQRIEQLEDDELELKATTPEFFVELLALYLCQNQLIDAKNLIQRVPSNMKTDNAELAQLEKLLNALNANNSADFFKNILYEWSDAIREIIQHLKMKTTEDVFKLVALAYTSILEKNLMDMTQMTQEELKSSCQRLGWSYEEDEMVQGDIEEQSAVILPVQRVNASSVVGDSKEQMFKLTEFVTFLEN